MSDNSTTRLQITETLNRYAWSYDTRDLDLMRECLAVNGVFDVTLGGEDGWGPHEGRETIVEWLASIMQEQTDQRRHCVTNIIFREIDGTTALVESYLMLTAVEDGVLRVVCTATYHDKMVVAYGRWVIQHKTLKLDNAF